MSGDVQVDICCNQVLLGAGDNGESKMAKHSQGEFEVLLSLEAVSLCLRFVL